MGWQLPVGRDTGSAGGSPGQSCVATALPSVPSKGAGQLGRAAGGSPRHQAPPQEGVFLIKHT